MCGYFSLQLVCIISDSSTKSCISYRYIVVFLQYSHRICLHRLYLYACLGALEPTVKLLLNLLSKCFFPIHSSLVHLINALALGMAT